MNNSFMFLLFFYHIIAIISYQVPRRMQDNLSKVTFISAIVILYVVRHQ